MVRSKLIEDLKRLKVNDISFKEDEERIIAELRKLYKENSDLFSDEDIKLIKIIDNIKDLAEDIKYCKSKECIDTLISDFHDITSEIEKDENISKRIQTYIRQCLEKKHLLPSEMIANEERKKIQSFGEPPNCPKCKKLLILRGSSRGYFWGCIDFPRCWGKIKASSKKKKSTLGVESEITKKQLLELQKKELIWNRLRELRLEIAIRKGKPPFVILHDSTLAEIVNKKPKTLIELNEISGIGQNMLEQYGKELLEIIGP